MRTLSTAAETMSLMTEGAGALIGTVRLMVRDAVATVVSRLIVYAAELVATAGLATPLVVEQVTTLCASWAAKIAGWLRRLLASLRRLLTDGDRLDKLIETLRRWFSEASTGGDPGKNRLDDENSGPRHGDPDFDSGQAPGGEVRQRLRRQSVVDLDDLRVAKEAAVGRSSSGEEGAIVHPRFNEQIPNWVELGREGPMTRWGRLRDAHRVLRS